MAGEVLCVADTTRVLKSKTLQGEKGGDIAKLFACHVKLQRHVVYLKQWTINSDWQSSTDRK